jgi:hypothetical protein
MTKKLLLFTCAMAMFAAPSAFAQIDPQIVQYLWGGIHVNINEVITYKFAVGESCTTGVGVVFNLNDRGGKTLYSKSIAIPAGHAFTYAISLGDNSSRNGVTFDALYNPGTSNLQMVTPQVRVIFPPGPCKQTDMTATAEKHDYISGRSIVFANNPHAVLVPKVKTNE